MESKCSGLRFGTMINGLGLSLGLCSRPTLRLRVRVRFMAWT